MITIRHTHEDGTLVYGTSKGDGVYELIGPRTGPRFRYFPSIKMIGIAQSRDRPAKRHQIQAAEQVLRAAGHEVTVEIDDAPRAVTEVRADRAGRLDDRYDRLTAKAQRAGAEAQSRHAAADAISERFAGGQPILVGHHSERRARRDHERMEQNDRAAGEAQREAERASAAAAVVGLADAYRDRPAVIIRRIDKTEAELRQIGHYLNGTRPANDWRGAYGYDRQPAGGTYRESLEARRTWLEHNLAADRAALAEHEANGYVRLNRETVHKGDTVAWSTRPGSDATVVRVNPKSVSLDRRSWPRVLPYEQIQSVTCPHEDKTVVVRAKRTVTRREAPAVPELAQAERPEPIRVDARTGYFPTPAAVVDQMISEAGLTPGMTVLEPSAGLGAIASVAAAAGAVVDCVELNGQMAGRLRGEPFARMVVCTDFLEYGPRDNPAGAEYYDRVLMNPPFAGQADIAHVTHALGFVKPGGRLVAVMSAGAQSRENKTAEGFRKLVADCGGWIERLPDESFAVSGTSVSTVLAVIPAPASTDETTAMAAAGEETA
jgi:predicted RNA methylase